MAPRPRKPSPTSPTPGDYGPRPRQPRTPEPVPFATNPAFEGERREQTWAAQNAGNQMLGAPTGDPFNDQPWTAALDQLFGILGPGSGGGSGGGGGGRGGGGAGRPRDPDPLGWNATARVQGLDSGYNAMLEALNRQRDATLGAMDRRRDDMTAANQAGVDRVNQILADLNANAATTRGEVAGSFRQGDQVLADLTNQYAQMVAARQPGVAQTIQAFGGDPAMAFGDPSMVQDMLTAQRANLARVGQADDALYANRSNVYQGLNADVSTQRQQMFDQLMARLLADRQVAEQQAAAQAAQLAMQRQQAILQAQAEEQARRANYV